MMNCTSLFKFFSLALISGWTLQVQAGPGTALKIVSAAQTVVAGACSSPVTVQSQDSGGAVAPVSKRVLISFAGSSSDFIFFSDSACSSSITSLAMNKGQTSKNFFFKNSNSGTKIVAVSASGYTGSQQSETIVTGSSTSTTTTTTTTTTTVPTGSTTLFFDDFSTYATTGCVADGSILGQWTSVFDGYGCNSIVSLPEGKAMSLKPQVSTTSSETHAGLVVGPNFSGSYTFETTVKTQQQLRTGTAPNPWEVAWVLWNYTDNTHFYYFIAKPNGWELGKEDPAYPGAQRFLAAGSSPSYPIGQWLNVKIVQSSNTIKVYVNGTLITSFTDNERPYSGGKIGFYSEDSLVYLKSAKVTAP